ncbi:MAG: hypothetical protein HS113_14495 [Verrucomicrobiales bacterium]|nr:hypothetical protein [Verrucomicrobiales bacterium]
MTQKWATHVLNGHTLLSTAEAGGSVTFIREYHPGDPDMPRVNPGDQIRRRGRKHRMKNNADTTKEAAAKDQTPKAKAPKTKREAAPKDEKAEKVAKKAKAKADADAETGDRLPGNLDELKATKGGLVSFLFLSGKDKEAIAAELKTAFKLGDAHAAKIVRRITGRVRLFQRVFELMAAK